MALPKTQTAQARESDMPPANVLMLEQHFSFSELAERWGVSHDFVRDLFIDEPGIIRGHGKNSTVRVPASVVERVYRRMQRSQGA